MQFLGRTIHYPLSRFLIQSHFLFSKQFSFFKFSETYEFLTCFSAFFVFISCSSSLILKPNSAFSCRLPMSSSTTLTSFFFLSHTHVSPCIATSIIIVSFFALSTTTISGLTSFQHHFFFLI